MVYEVLGTMINENTAIAGGYLLGIIGLIIAFIINISIEKKYIYIIYATVASFLATTILSGTPLVDGLIITSAIGVILAYIEMWADQKVTWTTLLFTFIMINVTFTVLAWNLGSNIIDPMNQAQVQYKIDLKTNMARIEYNQKVIESGGCPEGTDPSQCKNLLRIEGSENLFVNEVLYTMTSLLQVIELLFYFLGLMIIAPTYYYGMLLWHSISSPIYFLLVFGIFFLNATMIIQIIKLLFNKQA